MQNPERSSAHTRRSVVRLEDAWYVACRSRDIGRDKPIARTVLGYGLALFRDRDGHAAAVLDRCPHRNAPLSCGRVSEGRLQCGYHGWEFDGAGACVAVPGLPVLDVDRPGRRARSFPIVERDGFVWVWTGAGDARGEPFPLPQASWAGYTTVTHETSFDAPLHSVAENILDVPHTSFLHAGLFRTKAKHHRIEAVVRRGDTSVEAEFIGEPRPTGIAARVLSPSGGVITHFDRFFLPSIAQVEYRIGDENHMVVTSALSPEREEKTRLFAMVSFKMRLPWWLVLPVVAPIAWRILAQDRAILRLQSHVIARFGDEKFSSTPIDLLGPHVLALLKRAERGERGGAPREERVQLLV